MEHKSTGSGLQLITTRRTSSRHFLGLHLATVLAAAGIWAYAYLARPPALPVPVLAGAGLLPIAFGWGFSAIARRSRTYRLYRDSLETESGILSRRIDNLQLFRVRDVALQQGILDRALDVGDVIVTSTDASTPRLVLADVDDPRGMYATLRAAVAASQAEKRTMIVEGGPEAPAPRR